MKAWLGGAFLLLSATLVNAQAIKPDSPMRTFTPEEVAAITTPDLKFIETPEIAKDYDKYFYFHRENTKFEDAFDDISECDSLANGLRVHSGGKPNELAFYAITYGIGGVIGGVLGSALADAVYDAPRRRSAHRLSLRNCMKYKGYVRFGLSASRWKLFNFERGKGKPSEREAFLMIQAKIASGAMPVGKAIEQ
jgi:hypothetical protein